MAACRAEQIFRRGTVFCAQQFEAFDMGAYFLDSSYLDRAKIEMVIDSRRAAEVVFRVRNPDTMTLCELFQMIRTQAMPLLSSKAPSGRIAP
jgi:hypothetical protein